jgi:hypothetical protein
MTDATQQQLNLTQPGNQADGSQAAQAGSQSSAAADGAPTRPDGLPDKFWNPEKGVLVEDLVKDVATRHTSEAERAKSIPAGADHYKVELPADFRVPDGLAFKFDDKDPMVAFGRQFAASQKLTQTEFASLIGQYAAVQLQQAQAAQTRTAAEETAITADLEKLGPTKDVRIKAVEDFFSAHGGSSGAKIGKIIAREIGTSELIETVERVIASVTRGGASVSQAGREGAPEAKPPENATLAEQLTWAREHNRKQAAA